MCFSEERDVVRVKSSSHLEIARVLVRFDLDCWRAPRRRKAFRCSCGWKA